MADQAAAQDLAVVQSTLPIDRASDLPLTWDPLAQLPPPPAPHLQAILDGQTTFDSLAIPGLFWREEDAGRARYAAAAGFRIEEVWMRMIILARNSISSSTLQPALSAP